MEQDYMIIGADFAPIDADGEKIIQGKETQVLDENLATFIKEAKMSVFNMEAPIAYENMVPIKKDGPNLSILDGCERIYGELNIGLLLLANNHIMDYGEKGLFHTTKKLSENHISYIGAGKNKDEADQGYFFENAGKRIGIYAVADHEFSLAGEKESGANGYEESKTEEKIRKLKQACDYLIVIYHGGRELYPYPSPKQQERCRNMALAGADMVICQHSHCIGAFETYGNSSIFYGQGNFLFGDAEADICIYSILLKVSLKQEPEIEIVPIKRDGDKVILLSGKEEKQVREYFEKLSSDIQKDGFVEENYQKLADEAIAAYLYQFAGWPLFFIRLDKLFGRRMIKSFFRRNEKRLLYLQNILQCEAHREIVLEGLKGLRRDK